MPFLISALIHNFILQESKNPGTLDTFMYVSTNSTRNQKLY